MQAIETRYYGPTNFRGSRIRATCEAGTVTVSYDYALDLEENHDAAARALIRKLKWTDRHWVRGMLKNARGNVYVMVAKHGGSSLKMGRH